MVNFTEPSDGPWRFRRPMIYDANGEILCTVHANEIDGMLFRLCREMYAALETIAWQPDMTAEALQQTARDVLAKR